jgi:tetratricopeptide (TPR) repeat protein
LLQKFDGAETKPLLSTVTLALGEALTNAGEFVAAINILEESLGASERIDALSRARIKFNLAKALKATGSSEKALSLHEQALSLRLEILGEDHLNVASSLFSLAELYFDRHDYKQALSLVSECARIQATHGVRDGMFFALTELKLGLALRKFGEYDDSAIHLRRALISTEKVRGKDSPETARACFELGTVLCELGQLKDASVLLQQSLSARMDYFGHQHPDVGTTLEHIAILEQRQGNHRRALDLFGEALEIKRFFIEEYGDEIASLLHSMAVSHMELEHFNVASRIFEECATRFKAIYGLRHETVARALMKQGRALEKEGNLGDAIRCYKEALSCRSLKESSAEVGQLLFRMGNASFTVGDFTASWKLFNKAVEVLERYGSELSGDERRQNDEHIIICCERLMRLARVLPSSMSIDKMVILPKIALALVRLGNFSKAASIYRDILTRQQSTENTPTYEIASTLHNLGSCLFQVDDWSEALLCLDESLKMLRDIPDVSSLTVADTVHCLGLVHHARTDLHRALTCFQEAADLRKHNASMAHARSTLSLAITLQTLGLHDISMKRCNDAMRMLTDLQNDGPLMRADTMECMGLNHKARGDHQKAVLCFRDSLDERQRHLGENDLLVGQTLSHLGEALMLGGDSEKAYQCFGRAERIYGSHIGSRLEKGHMSNIDGRLSITGMVKFTSDLSIFMESQEALSQIAVADTLATFGRLKFLCKHFDEALICNELALAIYREALSPDHLKIADTNFTMGASRYERGDAEGSIMHLNESLQLRKKKLGDNHFDVFKTRQYLGRALAATGDTNEALICYRAITTKNFRGQHMLENSEEVGMMLQMGKLHLAAQEFSEAASCFEGCIKLLKNSTDRQSLAEALHCLGLTQFEMKMYAEAWKSLQSAMKIYEGGDGNQIDAIESLLLLVSLIFRFVLFCLACRSC